ncbi:MAG: HAD superfamily hydrolase (TIGR01509 family) [Oleispira sp.]|jgi:HAD superfamily hydrolase (TIGR01509 family)
MTIKLITFDLDNTLWHTDPVIIRAEQIQWRSIIARCPDASIRLTPEHLQQLKLKIAQQFPELRHKLSLFRIEFLFQLFIQCGFNKEQARLFADQVFADFLHARNQVELFPKALAVLEKLQQDYQVIALSNGNSDLTTIGLNHLFQAHYHAENVARAKPFADMFLAALDNAGVEADESFHIGDHPEQDVEAAKGLGFKTIWANVLQQEWPASVNKADHEITHLDQLIDVLKKYR